MDVTILVSSQGNTQPTKQENTMNNIAEATYYVADQTGEIFQLRVEERGRAFLGTFWCVGTYERRDGQWLLCDIDWAEDIFDAHAKATNIIEQQSQVTI
jgi:hypothetical protein